MNFLYKLEKNFGKYSIRNLPLILALLFAFNYLLSAAAPDIYYNLLLIPYNVFAEHQYWRLFTWIFTAPGAFDRWTVIKLVILYFIGTSAERGMGTFMFNLYMLGNMLLNFLTVLIVGGFTYFRGSNSGGVSIIDATDMISGGMFINWLVPTSVFFAFAIAYMEGTVYYMFLFTMKAKYVAAIDFAVLAYYYFAYPITTLRAIIVVNIANFFIFYAILKRYSFRKNAKYSFSDYSKNRKKRSFKVRDNENNVTDFSDYLNRRKASDKPLPESITRHKCAICGRTEKNDKDLVFRFCTKCNGSYEYCDEHIYTHEHVK